MPRSRAHPRMRDPQIFLLLPLLARPHRHAPILQTQPVDTSTLSAHESELAPRAVKLCVHSLNKIIPFLYHKRGDKNNYGMWKRWHITVFVIAPAARGAPWSIDEKSQ